MKEIQINIKNWLDKYRYSFEPKYEILMILAALHYHKKISDEKLKGQFSSLRTGKLLEMKRTFHCTINNRWYDCEKPVAVYRDVFEDFSGIDIVPFENFVEYIMLLENCNYNASINIFLDNYLRLLLRNWDPSCHVEDFNEYTDLRLPISLKALKSRNECYCCGAYQTNYDKNTISICRDITNYFHSIKKGNLKKIPLHKFEYTLR